MRCWCGWARRIPRRGRSASRSCRAAAVGLPLRGDEDAGAGEGAHADGDPVDLDGQGAVGRCRRDPSGAARDEVRVLEEVEQARGELELLGDALDLEGVADDDGGEWVR